MKHYGDDLKVMLQVGQIRDEKKTVSNICHGRSEWLLRIVPVYNISSMWLSDAAEYGRQEGIYRFGVKKAFKTADNYIEAGLNKVINSAKDEYGRKFILDLFDKSEDFMRSHTDGIFYPVFNYLSKLGFKHPNVSAALGVSLAVAEFTVTAEYTPQHTKGFSMDCSLSGGFFDGLFYFLNTACTRQANHNHL